MPDQFPNNDGTQHRIRRERTVIHANSGPISLGKSQVIQVFENGDVISDDTQDYITIDGQVIFDPHQVIGQCLECGKLLTARTLRYCYCCQQVRCPGCACLDSQTALWFCQECYKAIKSQRFWSAFRNSLLKPFRGRR